MVNPKGQPLYTLNTAARGFFPSNKDDCLSIRGQHTAEDLAAIQARVLALSVDSRAADYLVSIGGAATTRGEGWVIHPETGAPGKILEHIEWLQTRRLPLAAGIRFAVQASIAPALRRGSMRGNEVELCVFGAVALSLTSNNKSKAAFGMGDAVAINPRLLHLQWRALSPDLEKTTLPRIASVLRAHSTETVVHEGRTYWIVPIALVDQAVDVLGLDEIPEGSRTNIHAFKAKEAP
jgi:hypothetical protein